MEDTTMKLDGAPVGSALETGGITLLEAYSALARRNAPGATVSIPFPGRPLGLDPEEHFWQVRIKRLG